MLEALEQRGVYRVQRVTFRMNRSTFLSLSADGRSLNVHAAFARAPARVVDALAAWVRQGPDAGDALARIRRWPGLARGLRQARRQARQRAAARRRRERDRRAARGIVSQREASRQRLATPCCASDEQKRYLRALYVHYNRTRFGGRLPRDLTVRLSSRMRTRYGQVRLHRRADGRRVVVDIALHADLMLPGNDRDRHDTLLHEMAHAEAWLLHGHAGHGEQWKRIARRVGCSDAACAPRELKRRPDGRPPTDRVPDDIVRAA